MALSREELGRERAESLARRRAKSSEELERIRRFRIPEKVPVPFWKARPKIIRPEAP